MKIIEGIRNTNPFQERATITFPNPNHEEYQLTLRDLTGKVIKQISDITENQMELSRDNLPQGMYLIELRGTKIYWSKMVIE